MLGQHPVQSWDNTIPVLKTTLGFIRAILLCLLQSSRDVSCHKRDPAVSESSSEMLKIQFWNVSLLTRFFVG